MMLIIKLIRIYLMFIVFIVIPAAVIYLPTEKKTELKDEQIELKNNLSTENNKVNIINNGTANITINNNYYYDKEEKKVESYEIVSFYDFLINENQEKILFKINVKSETCFLEASTNFKYLRFTLKPEKIICKNNTTNVNGFIVGEDGSMDIKYKNVNNNEKVLMINLLSSIYTSLDNNYEKILEKYSEKIKDINIFEKNRTLTFFKKEEIQGMCLGNYKLDPISGTCKAEVKP